MYSREPPERSRLEDHNGPGTRLRRSERTHFADRRILAAAAVDRQGRRRATRIFALTVFRKSLINAHIPGSRICTIRLPGAPVDFFHRAVFAIGARADIVHP